MPGQPLTRAASRRWRLGILGVGLAALAAAGLLWQPSSEAGGTPFEPLVTAIAKDKQLEVGVAFPKETAREINGTLTVELLAADGQRLADTQKYLRGVDRRVGERLLLKADPATNKAARLRVSLAGRQAELPLAKALLVKAHEMSVTGGQEFHVGTPGTLSCDVHGVRSAIDTVPLPGSEVFVKLRDKAGKVRDLGMGRTGKTGRADLQFNVPDIAPGAYTLEILSRSVLGEEKIERPIRISADAKVLLVSDRPIYQPGHVIHLRALALRPFDMRPVAEQGHPVRGRGSQGQQGLQAARSRRRAYRRRLRRFPARRRGEHGRLSPARGARRHAGREDGAGQALRAAQVQDRGKSR